jgi:hypothetical protein
MNVRKEKRIIKKVPYPIPHITSQKERKNNKWIDRVESKKRILESTL